METRSKTLKAGKLESQKAKYNKAGKLKKPELVELEYIEIQET